MFSDFRTSKKGGAGRGSAKGKQSRVLEKKIETGGGTKSKSQLGDPKSSLIPHGQKNCIKVRERYVLGRGTPKKGKSEEQDRGQTKTWGEKVWGLSQRNKRR